jgi:protein involved in polysaccharide export with SLBB domain
MAGRIWFRNGIGVADEKRLGGSLDPGKGHEYDWLRMRWILTLGALWLLLAGCQSNQTEQVLSPGNFTAATSAAGYNTAVANATLGTNVTTRGIVPGITISITVQEDRTLNRAYVVPANGTIDFPPLGRIALENLTTDEAAQKIRDGLEKHYSRKVTVAVAIESALPGGGGVVYVMGNVSRPGPVVLPRGERYTVIQAIGAVGDFTASANGGKVQLVRYDPMGKKHVVYVNVDQITRGAELDVEVRDGDWIFVPGK